MNRRKLKVIVIGYYTKLNAGDDLLQQSIRHIFQDQDLLFIPGFLALTFATLLT